MKSQISGPRTILKLSVCLAMTAAFSLLGGCEKLKSKLDSIRHPHRAAKNALPARPSRAPVSGPRLAIVLDDLAGDDSAASEGAIFALHYPLTLSVLPFHAHSAEIAAQAHRRGYLVMLHLPMQAVGSEKPESNELRRGMSSSQIAKELNGMLAAVPYAAGVNNHQGSLATSDEQLMSELMPLLRDRKLFFIDSRTAGNTVAFDTARRDGVRAAFRNVPFLDDVREVTAIRHQLALAMKDAKEKGEAIAIGHPHPETLRALAEMLPEVQANGVQLVYASDLVH